MTAISATLESFFIDRLAKQRQVSAHTIAAYRDTMRLLLDFMTSRTGKRPSRLDWDDLDVEAVSAFLDHLQTDRGNSARTRNARLTAIRSLVHYASLRHPEHAALFARVLAIPPKRFDKASVSFLTPPEVAALLAAPDRGTWQGRRDHALLFVAIQTGLRISELIGLNCADIMTGPGGHVRCQGKGRKERTVPLTRETEAICECGSGWSGTGWSGWFRSCCRGCDSRSNWPVSAVSSR
jgi:site-specific recombinase XerD